MPTVLVNGWNSTGTSAANVTITHATGTGNTPAPVYFTQRPTVYVAPRYTLPFRHEESDEQRAARLRRQEEVTERVRTQHRERAVVERRGRELLLAHLDEEQRADFEETGSFVVRVGPRRYRIERGRVANVLCAEEGFRNRRYCIHPRENVPSGDHMLAQKLMLETDEETFLRIANVS